jgi:hypothetical protein
MEEQKRRQDIKTDGQGWQASLLEQEAKTDGQASDLGADAKTNGHLSEKD